MLSDRLTHLLFIVDTDNSNSSFVYSTTAHRNHQPPALLATYWLSETTTDDTSVFLVSRERHLFTAV